MLAERLQRRVDLQAMHSTLPEQTKQIFRQRPGDRADFSTAAS
jgi:hypothetical protein